MLRPVLFLLAITSALGQIRDAVYDDCGSTAEIISVQVEPCDSDPCVMKRGTPAKIHFEMVSDQDSQTAVLDVTTKLFGITIPVPGIEPNMCKEVVKCPIKKGQNYRGTVVMPIPSLAPAGESSLTLKVKGDKGVSVCATSKLILE